jgi:hypothetical protein
MRVYVNGTQVASQSQTGTINTPSSDVSLGAFSGMSNYFEGELDEAFIVNQAIGAAQVSALYVAGTRCGAAGG